MSRIILITLLALVSLLISPMGIGNAVESLTEWQYRAPIEKKGTNPYKAFYLPDEVYKDAKPSLSDLRIVGEEGEFVPYYIQRGAEIGEESETTYNSTLVYTGKENNKTILDYKMIPVMENADIQGNLLTMVIPEQDFLSKVTISGSLDGTHWKYVKEDTIYRADHRVKNQISLSEVYKYNYFRLVILNNDEGITVDDLQLTHAFK
ncbi:MAG: hypothetical protein WD907_04880, partial [Bacilli bacterium]